MKAAIILARLDSKRFPNKALSRLGNKRLIDWVIDGVRNIPGVEPILATTDRPGDGPLVDVALEKNIRYYTGSLDNVALRVVDCIKKFDIQHWARINGDSPFVQQELLTAAFELIENRRLDFVTNLSPRSFPYGISAEVFNASVFLAGYEKFATNDHFEHITSYFYEHISKYNYYNLVNNTPVTSTIRLTVDTPQDLELLNTLLDRLPDSEHIRWTDLVRAFQNQL